MFKAEILFRGELYPAVERIRIDTELPIIRNKHFFSIFMMSINCMFKIIVIDITVPKCRGLNLTCKAATLWIHCATTVMCTVLSTFRK